MSVPGDAIGYDGTLFNALFFASLFLMTWFAPLTWVCAFLTTSIFGNVWWHRHGYRSEAVIREKMEVRRKTRGVEDEDDGPPPTTFLVHLRYSVPTTTNGQKEETSRGRHGKEITMLDSPNWIVRPNSMRGNAVNESIPILVDPSNTQKITFDPGRINVCGALVLVCMVAVLPGMGVFLSFWWLTHIDENEANMETRVSSIMFFACVQVATFVWVCKQARSSYNQNGHYVEVADISEYERILVPTEDSSEGGELMEHVPTNSMEEANKP